MLPIGFLELDRISMLDSLADDYLRHFGAPPFNLSHWDPSDETVKLLLKHLQLQAPPAVIPYLYSGELDVQQAILSRLELSQDARECLIVPSGTSAVMFGALWLKALQITNTIILCPSYFPIFYNCKLMGLPFSRLYMHREGRSWHLPKLEILRAIASHPSESAIWITNPVYCAGAYLTAADADFFNSLLERGVALVIDECLSLCGQEISRLIADSDRVLALYSPHKSICINAIKFAVVVYNPAHSRLFSHWSDVLVGGLGGSTHVAILHFLDQNFSQYQEAFLRHIDHARCQVTQIARRNSPAIDLDEHVQGYFLTCYAPTIQPADPDEAFLRRLIFRTGSIMIPGSRNHFSPTTGFNFRVNLARACPQFFASFRRAVDYLASLS